VGADQFRSIYAVAIEPVAKEYHIGYVPSTLGVSLFLLGFVLGPVLVRLPLPWRAVPVSQWAGLGNMG
jgi:hypothetical protein